MSILSWLKGAICKLFDTNELAAKMQTLPADKDMTEAVRLWAECYRCTPPWAVADSNVRCLNLPYSVAHEMARLVTLELNSELTGSPRADHLSDAYSHAVALSPVWVEYACALGGVFLKPYVSGGKIYTDIIQADAAAVSGYDGDNITECVFADRIVRKGRYFTRLEKHSLSGTNYTVVNKAYVSDSSAQIGREIALDAVAEYKSFLDQSAS